MASSLDAVEGCEARGIFFKILVGNLKDTRLNRVSSGDIAEVVTEKATQVRVEESSLASGLLEPAQLLVGSWEQISPALVT